MFETQVFETQVFKTAKMNTPMIKIPFKLRFVSALRVMIDSFTIIFFKLRYWRRGKKMPPITHDILRQPAVEVARKIRNKEVSQLIILSIYT